MFRGFARTGDVRILGLCEDWRLGGLGFRGLDLCETVNVRGLGFMRICVVRGLSLCEVWGCMRTGVV